MCGIVGFIGEAKAAPILLEGLSKLEYRGYDSAGIAVRDESGKINVVKAKGRLKVLEDKTDSGNAVNGTCGIGHTRWATHGEPSEVNAHPHYSEGHSVVVVHNGIIENYLELKEKLVKSGYSFESQTDTEVVTKLIDYYYKKTGEPLTAIARTMLRVRGSYALGVMFSEQPDKLYAVRKDSPLIVGKSEKGYLIASDVPAILSHTRKVYYIDNLEIVEITRENVHFYNIDREEIEKEAVEIKWDAEAAEKGGYEHFMMKEIHEQPEAVRNTIGAYVKDGNIDFGKGVFDCEQAKKLERIYIVACGSAYHVAAVAKYVIEDITTVCVETDLASEFRYRNPKLSKNSMVVIISQSGETADSLAALRLAKEKGVKTLAIVNVVGSSIAREADSVIYTLAGPEIAVATTKAYSTQLIISYLLAMYIANARGEMEKQTFDKMLSEMALLPKRIEDILHDKERIQWFASKFANASNVFFIGRGIDYAISLEGSLKMKEISYIHSEAYAAGELKHGTISLIEDGVLVIGVMTQSELYDKMLSNMIEVKSRGAYLMGITNVGNYSIEDTANFTVYVPRTDEHFVTSLAIVPLQLMGYYISVARGLDVDKPRNLAKSVTVE
ncbi:MAG: glutamine--fructose-6-phosphate transaminase (isomerizing) [Lachnospiraceae bacterium]|nr:glutamine--fructose-6-phosphate transaminase (isomerizing) [Lachnospiraceae bacterium]